MGTCLGDTQWYDGIVNRVSNITLPATTNNGNSMSPIQTIPVSKPVGIDVSSDASLSKVGLMILLGSAALKVVL